MIFFDSDPTGDLFSNLPNIDEGPITFGLPPIPEGIQLKVRIPAVIMTHRCVTGAFETDMAWLVFEEPASFGEKFFGFQLGFIVFPNRDGNGGLSKSKADILMTQFLEDRKKERLQEKQLLESKRTRGDAEVDLKSKEFFGDNFFHSVNPFKQVTETGDLDNKMSERVVNTFAQQTGLSALQERFKGLQRDFEKAIPLQVAWENDAVAGIKLPVIKAKELDPAGLRVWSFTGMPPCAISMRLPDDNTVLFCMLFDSKKHQISCNIRKNGKFIEDQEFNYPPSWNERQVTWVVTMDNRGFHVSFDGQWSFCYVHRSEWHPDMAEKIIVEKDPTRNRVEVCGLSARLGIIEPKTEDDVQAVNNVDLKQWKLVFRQTAPFVFSEDRDFSQARRLNAHDEQASNYSILGDLEKYRCEDGCFTFMLLYPEKPDLANIWRQSSNPVTMKEEGVDDFSEIRSSWAAGGWGGLQRSDRRKKENCFSFIDGCPEHGENWNFAIGICNLLDSSLLGPDKSTCLLVRKVELYVSTTFEYQIKDRHSSLCARDIMWDQGTSKDNPLCEHGCKKPECLMCKDQLAGRFIVDHNPHMPCVPGHGPRWLFDKRSRGLGRLTFDSTQFFDDLTAAPARSCKRTLWPSPYTPDFHQDNCNGYFILRSQEGMLFAGHVKDGLPDAFGSLKWPDGAEYHGEFDDGDMSGYGRYIFADGGEFRGVFYCGLPRRGFYHPPEREVRRVADYEQRLPNTPLWEMSSQELLYPTMVDMPMPQFAWSKADCVAIVKVLQVADKSDPSAPLKDVDDFTHISKPVTARLVWARPIHADQPLWNADEVRGKIVACLRGPRPPAKACSYNLKLYHAQNAGAVGVVVVDCYPDGVFNLIPRFECGTFVCLCACLWLSRRSLFLFLHPDEVRSSSKKIPMTVYDVMRLAGPLWPGGPHVDVRIPAFWTVNVMGGALQEVRMDTANNGNVFRCN